MKQAELLMDMWLLLEVRLLLETLLLIHQYPIVNESLLIITSQNTDHDLQGFGVEDVYFVGVAAPDMLVGHHTHTAHRVVGLAQVYQVVVGQVPLTI